MNVDKFISTGFKLIEEYKYNDYYSSYIFEYNDIIIIIDDNFDISDKGFPYYFYCSMQNDYMYNYDKVLRFNNIGNDNNLINEIIYLINLKKEDLDLNDTGGNRDKSHYDNTPAEKMFEDAFVETYGLDSLEYLQKEVQFSLGNRKTASVDFLVETKTKHYSFEANGISFHDPFIVGKEHYIEQLQRQNILVLFGIKVYRFSSDILCIKDKMVEELKKYLTNKEDFIANNIIKESRKVKLYKHQEHILKELDIDRKNGKTTALIVLPTGTGKSQICIEDLKKDNIRKEVKRVLIMTPSIKIKQDWLDRINELKEFNYDIDIACYNYVFATRYEKTRDYYDYIIFDEAHHAVAANCKKTIQYFTPKYLIGLTATPSRLDEQKLEDVFGEYDVNLSLEEAIKQKVVVDVACFRLKSNLNLSQIRYNGKDYNEGDLQKSVIVDSRNILIAKTLKEYFAPKGNFYKQGIVFCVNKEHTKAMAKTLNEYGLVAKAVYGGNSENEQTFEKYLNKEVQFLCSCQLISEGWDSPQTEVIVMARPTLSRVLYLQQVGRGLRHYKGKDCLYLIDVVDNYAASLNPWSFHAIMKNANYIPFTSPITNSDYIAILGLNEYILKLEKVDILTFEEKYGDYYSLEQAARELYVGTETLNKWNKERHYAKLYLPIGLKKVPYFSKDDILYIRQEHNLKVHNNDTILEDFLEFIDENTLTFSFKLVFILLCFKLANRYGEIKLDELTNAYKEFYLTRILNGKMVDKKGCIYTKEYLNDNVKIKRNMLENPFEKYERKRFLNYYLAKDKKDLNIIYFNPVLWSKLTKDIKDEIINKELKFLSEYYEKYGGLGDEYKQLL